MFSRSPKVLIVDDDIELITLLVDYLSLEGFLPSYASCGIDGITAMTKEDFDIVILDMMMPGMSGMETLNEIRKRWQTPVLMLTAKGDPLDRILGLEMGADDYVSKPCPPRELVARLKAIMRRTSKSDNGLSPIRLGELTVDVARRRVAFADREVVLTGTELALLEMLARQAGRPVPKAEIYPRILGREMGPYDRAIDVHISSIRHKFAEVAGSAISIESIRGVGYQLVYSGVP